MVHNLAPPSQNQNQVVLPCWLLKCPTCEHAFAKCPKCYKLFPKYDDYYKHLVDADGMMQNCGHQVRAALSHARALARPQPQIQARVQAQVQTRAQVQHLDLELRLAPPISRQP